MIDNVVFGAAHVKFVIYCEKGLPQNLKINCNQVPKMIKTQKHGYTKTTGFVLCSVCSKHTNINSKSR